ncbi:MAG TPA: ROK family transcriptional regulator [Povalibacter sp.]|jgi:predicted NBD/HSP70 family sugar kinase|nr:ROK family transcriptional regulator [Povalibacter sp.]
MQTSDRRRRENLRTQTASLSGTNLERAGDYNQRVTLQAIRVHGTITRVDLAQLTGLTTPAIANITNRLLSEGLIMEVGKQHGRRGQPAMQIAIDPDGCFAIGVNIDRDHVTVVALDFLGNVRARASAQIDFALPNDVADFVRKAIDRMFRQKSLPRDRIIGTGVALPDDLGRINLPHRPSSYGVWTTVDIPRLFADILPQPLFVENDAAAAAIGELQFGHGLRSTTFFYILISAALGGGLVIDGTYFRGADGRSGEIGFLPLRSRRTEARSLQEAVSLSALYQRLHKAGIKVSRPEQLASVSAAGKEVIDEWVRDAADFLTDPLIAVSCLVNPKAIFIGGRLCSDLVDRLADELNERLKRRSGDVPVIAPVLRAAMAADAPAIGAAILPFTERLLPSRAALMKASGG